LVDANLDAFCNGRRAGQRGARLFHDAHEDEHEHDDEYPTGIEIGPGRTFSVIAHYEENSHSAVTVKTAEDGRMSVIIIDADPATYDLTQYGGHDD
jgi:hypothetical protein